MKKTEFAITDKVYNYDIKSIRKKLGLSQAEFAALVNVSVKTIERWEGSNAKEITGPVVPLIKILREYPQIYEELVVKPQKYPLRLKYMCFNEICTIIDVDERERRISIENHTNDYMRRAFGKIDKPTYEQYEEFLENRCFPRSRDKMKLELRELEIPFYDPIMIIQKTGGRMAEDNFWIKIERK